MNTTEEKKNAYLQKFDRENDLSELGWGESKRSVKKQLNCCKKKKA